jgi:hypothetical protein
MKPHKLDAVSLVFGLLFLTAGLVFLLPVSGPDLVGRIVETASWAGPALIIIAGLALVVGVLRKGRQEFSPPES